MGTSMMTSMHVDDKKSLVHRGSMHTNRGEASNVPATFTVDGSCTGMHTKLGHETKPSPCNALPHLDCGLVFICSEC